MKNSSPVGELTPKHVRAARALLAWSQQDLAKAASVGISTVADFERGSRTPVANNAYAIRVALEGAGISFLPTGAVIGPALPSIAGIDVAGTPVRWVSAQDLSDWGDRTDGPVSLPTLLAKLVQAATDPSVELRFPSDEGIRHSGWDGVTAAATGNAYVPKGRAGWELGVQRRNIQQKATEDYGKRTTTPSPLDPADSTYIFVTLRHWPQKVAWSEARQAEGPWREVRVYDADDLVHWIERHPAVGLWIAARLNKRPPGTRELDEVWEEWSLATEWPLTEDLVLADRSEDSAEILRWLRGAPSVLSLQATTTDEVVGFFHAALSELPYEVGAAYRARALVVTTAEAARALINAPSPLILLLTEPDPGLARALVKHGHFVLQTYDERLIGRGEVRALSRPSREGIAIALQQAGISEQRAEALARDCARNLAVLRRLIPGAPGRLPWWAEGAPPKALLAALLAGGWIDTSEGDRARVAELADQPYDAAIADLAPLVGAFDSPLQKVGDAWRIASPSDAWILLAHHLTPSDVSRFQNVVQEVLGAPDPRFDMKPDDRWMADIHGVRPSYSGLLRHGVGQVLILLALWGSKIRTVADAPRRADAIVANLLRDADARRWWSLSSDFRLLAEASPSAFLTAIEDSLDQNDPQIGALFGHDDGGIFGTEHLSDLMWALESLAWSPDWMPRVTHVLARLDAIDVKPRKYMNGPMNSLREIHLLWSPQTYATQEQRIRALDLIRKREPATAWKLMLGVLPSGHDTSSPSPLPRWRDFSVDKLEVVSWNLIGRGAANVRERLIFDVGTDLQRWLTLLDRLSDLSPDLDSVLVSLDLIESKVTDAADRTALWAKLRHVLHHHREFPDAEWSLPEDVLLRLEAAYERFAPEDILARAAWLFDGTVALPKPAGDGWEAEEREIEVARQAAAQAIFRGGSIAAILGLAQLVDSPGYIGKALYESGIAISDLDALLEAAARSADAHERDVAHGLITSAFRDRKEAWAEALIAKARAASWGETGLMTILRALPTSRWTWDQVAAIGGEALATYWRRTPVLWIDGDSDDIAYAVRQLIEVGRARHAVALVGRRDKKSLLPSALLLQVLEQAARQPIEDREDGNEATMFQHYVAETLTKLDARDDVDRNALATLEWNYLRVLEHSRRPAKVLLSVLAEQPKLFIEMLSAVFKASAESGIEEPEPLDPEHARVVARQAYRLLELWNHIPGRGADNTIDGETLETWIKEARAQAQAVGRLEIADSQIGQVLSASPRGADGNWPAEPVRDVLDLFRSKSMLEGFRVGKANRRGMTTRMPGDGGELERNEAAKYRNWAKVIAFQHPHTAKALSELADSYDWQAKREDESAERRDWS
ncbi:helix-turn-helix domain-containing protein [Mesorhizobium sp. M7A.F.Ca.MR.362.00.0.0]|uniref:helix-turn-helix domain-containing protein n=1 Tax=Mesorhizobium sp. M7A.F.Ca.MR.362.00.0.0 TaxID=2496779 RepID=UPI001FE0096A|nr:helix-turn-helix domain-containing protein [Mesorhizobium sp. M7A.F.Ca.MR.362.00.0.0]